MSLRPTNYPDIHDEFYFPAGLTAREKKPQRQVGYDMGLNGARVTQEFLEDQAQVYHGRLNSATHTIDQRAHIVKKRSGDLLRNFSLVVLAVGGFVVLGLALMVDYKILHDFWTVVYSNEFLVVPESLKDNVVFKSLQVLFAVIAIHFLISVPGILGKALRGMFMVSIGFMVIGMLIGLGFLAAKTTLPQGSSLLGTELTRGADTRRANDDLLADLGLRPSSGITESVAAPSVDAAGDGIMPGLVRAYANDPTSIETIVFFSTFTLIFLFVSSVGALCMHYGLKATDALFGGVGDERPERALPEGLAGVAYWMPSRTKRGTPPTMEATSSAASSGRLLAEMVRSTRKLLTEPS